MKKIAILIMLTISLYAHAQQYTVKELIDSTLKNNVDIQSASYKLQSAQMDLYTSRINFLPEVSADAGFSRNLLEGNVDETEPRIRHNPTYSMGFSITKDISLNNTDYYTNRFAKYDLSIEQIAFEETRQDILYKLISKYIDVLEQQKQYQLQQEYLKIQESILSERQTQFQLRRITQYDLQQSEIDLLNTQIRSLETRERISQFRRDLFNIVNIADDGRELQEIDLYSTDIDLNREIDYDTILSVRRQNEVVARARTSLNRRVFNFFPSLSLGYGYARDYSGGDLAMEDPVGTRHSIGLSLRYSLNDLWKNRYQYKQVKFLQEQQQLNTDQLYKNIAQQYDQLKTDLSLYQQMQTLLERRAEQTTINLDTAEQRHRLGYLNQNDLDTARYNNNVARIEMESNRYKIVLKKLEIDNLLSIRFYE